MLGQDHLDVDSRVTNSTNMTTALRWRYTSNMSSAGVGRRRGGRRWKLLTPAVMWTTLMLAMAPSLHGFGVARVPHPGCRSPFSSSSTSGGFALANKDAGGVEAAHSRPGSVNWGERGGSWLKSRIRESKRKLHMQVCESM